MTKIHNDGGSAFPGERRIARGVLDSYFVPGMTLRDYFAGKAMIALLAEIKFYPDEYWREHLAIDAYKMADAMISMRNAATSESPSTTA